MVMLFGSSYLFEELVICSGGVLYVFVLKECNVIELVWLLVILFELEIIYKLEEGE